MMGEEERSCANEPWPLFLARKSIECLSNLIRPDAAMEETGDWANSSAMPFTVTAHDSSVGA